MRYKFLVVFSVSVFLNSAFFPSAASPAPGFQAQTQSLPWSRQYNIVVGTDERLFVMMAALLLAGYDEETAGAPPNDLRRQLRADIKPTDPELVGKLRSFHKLHLRADREPATGATPYIALAFALGDPPTFAPPASREFLPNDVNDLIGFGPLLAELYAKSNLRELTPKYAPLYNRTAAPLQQAVDEQTAAILSLLHTNPTLVLPGDPTPADNPASSAPSKNDGSGKKGGDPRPPQSVGPPMRTRRLFILPDLFGPASRLYSRNDVLNGADTKTFRRAGDDYALFVGPHVNPPLTAIRLTVLRFVLEPVTARSGLAVAARRSDVFDIVKGLPNAGKVDPVLQRNVFEIVRESLIRACEARLRVRASTRENPYIEEDALYDVGTAHERGAVLAFHFYEQLDVLERVGIDIVEFLPKMLETFDPAREAKRPGEQTALRVRVEARRSAARATTAPVSGELARLAEADSLIAARRYGDAQSVLEAVLKENSKSARAKFGLAQVFNNSPSEAELDEKADEGDKIAAQEQRLAKAVDLYKEAAEAAGPDEKWLVSQSYMLIGRIYDFAELREAAVEAYEKAIAVGEVKDGAYKEAVEGKQRPYRRER